MAGFARQLREGAGHAWASVSEGWRELRARAGGALTRFRHEGPGAPGAAGSTGGFDPAAWGLLAADLLLEDDRVVVRLEAPGLAREDLRIDVDADRLVVSGEKRVDRDVGTGQYRLVQCAYGRFRRDMPLPVPVDAARASASYRDGVLRIELPRPERSRGRRVEVRGG